MIDRKIHKTKAILILDPSDNDISPLRTNNFSKLWKTSVNFDKKIDTQSSKALGFGFTSKKISKVFWVYNAPRMGVIPTKTQSYVTPPWGGGVAMSH